MRIKDTLNIDPYSFEEEEEEIDEDLEMWELEELNKNYKFGTNSWDL
ncbi:hypothetical protein LZ906_017475 (plasmid) [Paraclostridium ghonii]|nr:hypothetical protein [Paeniclostridium ghonii]MCM0166550.1 hypothetical protein [Paeniclostridium ghonii]